jgi:hypothetical protein
LEGGKPLKALRGQRVLWFGCKSACETDETAADPNSAQPLADRRTNALRADQA